MRILKGASAANLRVIVLGQFRNGGHECEAFAFGRRACWSVLDENFFGELDLRLSEILERRVGVRDLESGKVVSNFHIVSLTIPHFQSRIPYLI